jgi:repressor LexA
MGSENKIKKAMDEAGLNQTDLAERLNIQQSMVSHWLRGARNPSINSLKKIAKAVKKPLSYFIVEDTIQSEAQIELSYVPILGTSSATKEKFVLEEKEGFLNVPRTGKNQFAIRVEGNCMVDPGDAENSIYHGNYVIVDPDIIPMNGDVVIVRLDKEYSTIKRLFVHEDIVRLMPDNPICKTIEKPVKDIEIVGKVVNVHRVLKRKKERI